MYYILYYTPFLFGIIGYAGTRLDVWLGPASIGLMGLSILHHAKNHKARYPGKRIVDAADATLAHAIAVGTLCHALSLQQTAYVLGVYACFVWCAYVFHIGRGCYAPGARGVLWHGTIHCAGALGCGCLLRAIAVDESLREDEY